MSNDNVSTVTEVTITPHPERAGLYRLMSELWLPQSIETVFNFFADAANLQTLTPPWLNFEIVSPVPADLGTGTLIDYRLRLYGFPLRWRSEIRDWRPPHEFADVMLRGPYREWHHTHLFIAVNGGTNVIDRVDYGVPGGAIVQALVVRRDLLRIFEFRRQRLLALFATKETD